MTIHGVIFDFGGVIVDLKNLHGQRKWEEYLGLSPGALFRAVLGSEISDRAMVGKVSEEKVWRSVTASFGLDAQQQREFRRDFWQGERTNAELIQFIRSLRPHYKTAILSNAWDGARQEFIREFEMDKVMDLMVISAEEGMVKPDSRIYQITLERLGVRAEQTVFVDDTLVNIQAAQAVGMRGVHFKNNTQTIAEIKEHLKHV